MVFPLVMVRLATVAVARGAVAIDVATRTFIARAIAVGLAAAFTTFEQAFLSGGAGTFTPTTATAATTTPAATTASSAFASSTLTSGAFRPRCTGSAGSFRRDSCSDIRRYCALSGDGRGCSFVLLRRLSFALAVAFLIAVLVPILVTLLAAA